MVDDRDVAGVQPPHEAVGAAVESRDAADAGKAVSARRSRCEPHGGPSCHPICRPAPAAPRAQDASFSGGFTGFAPTPVRRRSRRPRRPAVRRRARGRSRSRSRRASGPVRPRDRRRRRSRTSLAVTRGSVRSRRLVDDDVPVGERRDLGQVGHHEHLVVAGQPGQPPADLHRGPAADAGVDLVEDHRRHRVGAGEAHLERQHDPRQLAAGRAAPDRQRRRVRVRPQQELDLVGAVRADPAWASPCTVRLAPRAATGRGRTSMLTLALGIARPASSAVTAVASVAAAGRRASDRCSASSARAPRRPRSRCAASAASGLVGHVEVGQPDARPVGPARARVEVAVAVLAHQAVQHRPACLDLLQAGRVGVQLLGVRRRSPRPGPTPRPARSTSRPSARRVRGRRRPAAAARGGPGRAGWRRRRRRPPWSSGSPSKRVVRGSGGQRSASACASRSASSGVDVLAGLRGRRARSRRCRARAGRPHGAAPRAGWCGRPAAAAASRQRSIRRPRTRRRSTPAYRSSAARCSAGSGQPELVGLAMDREQAARPTRRARPPARRTARRRRGTARPR